MRHGITETELEIVFERLRQNPGTCLVHPSGKLLIALVDPETDQFMAIEAKAGVDFNTMSEEVLNHYIRETLNAL